MPAEVIMPALGMAQETGKVLRWFKQPGEAVSKGEPLMEIETDKVTVEIEAPADGTLAAVRAAEGDDVPVGQVVAFVVAEGEELAEEEQPVVSTAPPPTVAASPSNGSGALEQGSPPARRVLASPKARRLARERGVEIDAVRGTGPRGAIQAADVLAVVDAAPSAAPVRSGAWNTMAARMQTAWREVPHFYLERSVDATRLNSWRETTRGRPGYEKVTHTDLLIAICGTALAQHPRVNATWRDESVELNDAIGIGVAVATDDALVVPVIHDADRLELRSISETRADLVARARSRALRPADVTGGTFTISNLGMFGVDAFHAIVNTPQAAILAVGRIRDQVVPVRGEAVVQATMTVSLSFDHRVVDGAEGARFLDTLVGYIEEPAALVR